MGYLFILIGLLSQSMTQVTHWKVLCSNQNKDVKDSTLPYCKIEKHSSMWTSNPKCKNGHQAWGFWNDTISSLGLATLQIRTCPHAHDYM